MSVEVRVVLESVSPYSQSKVMPDRDKSIPADEWEKLHWRERIHQNEDGNVIIPAQAFTGALANAAKRLGRRIPGRGQSTYTKPFMSGVMLLENVVLETKAKDVEGEWLHLNADGVKGGGKRVHKCMPVVPSWKAALTFHVFDGNITEDVFREHLAAAGMFVGIGRWRPENGGTKGRFQIVEMEWSPVAAVA